VSPATVQRIWKKHGIRMQRFHNKLSRKAELGLEVVAPPE
jgi:hypothetical protein